MTSARPRLLSMVLLAAALAPLPASALTLDWSANPWPSTGTRTASFSVDGDDVIVTVTDPNTVITTGGTGPPSLETNQHVSPVDSLFLKTTGNTASPWVTVDVVFTHPEGVTDVSFSLFDIDLNPLFTIFGFPIAGFTDAIVLSGSDGTDTFAPSSITAGSATPTFSIQGGDTLIGTADNPAGSFDGEAIVTFDQVLTSFSFTYRNDLAQGQLQWIGFGPIQFRRAPEPGSALLLGLGLALLAAARRR